MPKSQAPENFRQAVDGAFATLGNWSSCKNAKEFLDMMEAFDSTSAAWKQSALQKFLTTHARSLDTATIERVTLRAHQ